MKFGITLPNLGVEGGVRVLADLAAEARGIGVGRRVHLGLGVEPGLERRLLRRSGNSSRDAAKARAKVQSFSDAGATWWLEGVWSFVGDRDDGLHRMRSRIAAGPPTPA